MVIQGIIGRNCNREFQVKNKFFKSSQQQGLSGMGVVCVLPSLGVCGIWLDITYLEQPGATCQWISQSFPPPMRGAILWLTPELLVPKLHKEMDQVLTASSPLSGGPIPPSTVGSKVWKGHNLQGLPGLSGPSWLYLLAPLFHFYASLCPQALLRSRKGGGTLLGVNDYHLTLIRASPRGYFWSLRAM